MNLKCYLITEVGGGSGPAPEENRPPAPEYLPVPKWWAQRTVQAAELEAARWRWAFFLVLWAAAVGWALVLFNA